MVCSFVLNCKRNRGIAQLVARLSGGQEVVSSSLATPTKKIRQVSTCRIFLSIAKAMVYHHALARISSPKGISPTECCMFFRNDDIQCRCIDDMQNFVLMICTPSA